MHKHAKLGIQFFTLVVIVVKNWKQCKCQMIRDGEVNHGMCVLWSIYSHFIHGTVFVDAVMIIAK